MLLQNSVSNAQTANSECVIFLHGMGRSALSMRSIEKYLHERGYHTLNRDYPSTSYTIEQIANKSIPKLIDECKTKASKIHFVTHSLGGIITRYYLQSNHLPKGSRIVMLSPPNKGSEIADRLRDSAWYKWLTGPSGQQLTTDADSVPNKLKPINYEVGIITGRRTLEPWFSQFIPGEDDGKVSVKRARLTEMTDFLVVDHAHTFIMNSNLVKEQVIHFLQNGYFAQSYKKKI
jgi:pimeloyl-ACP methyl ester carboxylesterase